MGKMNTFIAILLMGAASVPLGSAQAKFKVLHAFAGGNDGSTPASSVTKAKDGNIYGTTLYGGGSATCSSGCGAVFKISNGVESVLYAFSGGNDGAQPYAGLAADSGSNLYGTTLGGGANNNGVVFKLTPGGKETVLHAFTGGNDGSLPFGAVIRDNKSGNLYGTTVHGGGSANCTNGCGTAFKIASDGTYTVLHAFSGTDGKGPTGALAVDRAGNIYGATELGGDNDSGVIFKLAQDGTETPLYSFSGEVYVPLAGVVRDSAGNLYTAPQGGQYGYGAIFKLATDGTGTVLYSFTEGSDGGDPYSATLALDAAGNVYGAAYDGGSGNCQYGCGTIFKLAPDGTETTLHSFNGGKDGCYPNGGVLIKKSALYGTASGCGANGLGTVFRLTQ